MLPENRKGTFVGRDAELHEFRKLLRGQITRRNIVFVLGGGGIGKTHLVRRMLVDARNAGFYAPVEPLDFFSTDLRYIDGIQLKVIELIENLTDLKGEQSPFAEYYKENQDTSEQFNKCLKAFCEENSLVLAFDTFENLDTVASNWLFEGGNEGLQVPGLICIVAGRPEKENLEKYRSIQNVKQIVLTGLTLPEAEKLYKRISNELGQVDLLDEFLVAAGIEKTESLQDEENLRWIWDITAGHPLKLEMSFRWSGTLLRKESLIGVNAEKFEEKLLERVRELGALGLLDVGPLRVSQPVFDTLVCMAYVTRRFDERFLQFLIDENHIRLGEPNVTIANILENLEKYFFVKRRYNGNEPPILQLHDEMTRLIREHVWPYVDPSGEEKHRLLKSIIKYYDQIIKDIKDEDARNILQIERLYYTLESDPNGEGKRTWFGLAELDNEYVNSLLPGEIRKYIELFDPETQFKIRERIAQNEIEANHLTQARREWMSIKELAMAEQRDDWMASALFSLANCERDVSQALRAYQRARVFCEGKAPEYLPNVYYNIGFTYRRMQNIKMAIHWYMRAKEEFQKHPVDTGLEAKIANDLGYAYSHLGNWEECRKNVKEGQKIRQSLFPHYEMDETELRSLVNSGRDGSARKASFQLGLSYSTLGEVYRYDDDLDASLRNYGEALKLFRVSNNNQWQARTLFSRGEAYRRIARSKYWKDSDPTYRAYMKKAQEDIEESLYLCEKYRIRNERDTANRRMGRVLHDLAIYEMERDNIPDARIYLDQAQLYFEDALKIAKETDDTLEEISSLAELAFVVDDFIIIDGADKVHPKYEAALDEFRRGLDRHRKDEFRIYQFEVFENLYLLEKAATNYQKGNLRAALRGYLQGFVGLAADPGYGRTRYKQHFPHLTDQIEKLPDKEAKIWCDRFISAWEKNRVKGRPGKILAKEVLPDLVVWCRKHLNKRAG